MACTTAGNRIGEHGIHVIPCSFLHAQPNPWHAISRASLDVFTPNTKHARANRGWVTAVGRVLHTNSTGTDRWHCHPAGPPTSILRPNQLSNPPTMQRPSTTGGGYVARPSWDEPGQVLLWRLESANPPQQGVAQRPIEPTLRLLLEALLKTGLRYALPHLSNRAVQDQLRRPTSSSASRQFTPKYPSRRERYFARQFWCRQKCTPSREKRSSMPRKMRRLLWRQFAHWRWNFRISTINSHKSHRLFGLQELGDKVIYIMAGRDFLRPCK